MIYLSFVAQVPGPAAAATRQSACAACAWLTPISPNALWHEHASCQTPRNFLESSTQHGLGHQKIGRSAAKPAPPSLSRHSSVANAARGRKLRGRAARACAQWAGDDLNDGRLAGEAAVNRLRSKPVQLTRRQADLRSSRSAAWRRPADDRTELREQASRPQSRGATSARVSLRGGVYKVRHCPYYWAGQSPLALWECEWTSLS